MFPSTLEPSGPARGVQGTVRWALRFTERWEVKSSCISHNWRSDKTAPIVWQHPVDPQCQGAKVIKLHPEIHLCSEIHPFICIKSMLLGAAPAPMTEPGLVVRQTHPRRPGTPRMAFCGSQTPSSPKSPKSTPKLCQHLLREWQSRVLHPGFLPAPSPQSTAC